MWIRSLAWPDPDKLGTAKPVTWKETVNREKPLLPRLVGLLQMGKARRKQQYDLAVDVLVLAKVNEGLQMGQVLNDVAAPMEVQLGKFSADLAHRLAASPKNITKY